MCFFPDDKCILCVQALSLPVTNIAFTLKIFMGDSAEPLSAVNLIGLVLVCIGFLTYSGVGLAHNFMVAQVGECIFIVCTSNCVQSFNVRLHQNFIISLRRMKIVFSEYLCM